jgi:hypothetical protein
LLKALNQGGTMKNSLWFFFAILSSCAHFSLNKTNSSFTIKKAQALYEDGDVEASIFTLEQLVNNNPYDSFHDQVYELIVEYLLQLGRTKQAQKVGSYFLANHQESPSADRIVKMFNIDIKTKEEEIEIEKEPEKSPEIEIDALLD